MTEVLHITSKINKNKKNRFHVQAVKKPKFKMYSLYKFINYEDLSYERDGKGKHKTNSIAFRCSKLLDSRMTG
jgi:hypothetical protein